MNSFKLMELFIYVQSDFKEHSGPRAVGLLCYSLLYTTHTSVQ